MMILRTFIVEKVDSDQKWESKLNLLCAIHSIFMLLVGAVLAGDILYRIEATLLLVASTDYNIMAPFSNIW